MRLLKFVTENVLFLGFVLVALAAKAQCQEMIPAQYGPSYIPFQTLPRPLPGPEPYQSPMQVPPIQTPPMQPVVRQPDVFHYHVHEFRQQPPQGNGWYWYPSTQNYQRDVCVPQCQTYQQPYLYQYQPIAVRRSCWPLW